MSGTIDRTALAEVWGEIIAAMPTGGTQRERQAYGNGARDTLDAISDFLGLPLEGDPWDRWIADADTSEGPAVLAPAPRDVRWGRR